MESALGKLSEFSFEHFIRTISITQLVGSVFMGVLFLFVEGYQYAIMALVFTLILGFIPALFVWFIFYIIKDFTALTRTLPTILLQISCLLVIIILMHFCFAAAAIMQKGDDNYFNAFVEYTYSYVQYLVYGVLYSVLIPIIDAYITRYGFHLHIFRFPKPPQSERPGHGLKDEEVLNRD